MTQRFPLEFNIWVIPLWETFNVAALIWNWWLWKKETSFLVQSYKSSLVIYYHKRSGKIYCCCFCLVSKSWKLFCDPIDCSLPGSSVHEIIQVRIVEQVAISFPKGSSQPRERACVSCIDNRSDCRMPIIESLLQNHMQPSC